MIIYDMRSNGAFVGVSMCVLLKLSFVGVDFGDRCRCHNERWPGENGSLSNPTYNSFEFQVARTTPSCTMPLAMGIWPF